MTQNKIWVEYQRLALVLRRGSAAPENTLLAPLKQRQQQQQHQSGESGGSSYNHNASPHSSSESSSYDNNEHYSHYDKEDKPVSDKDGLLPPQVMNASSESPSLDHSLTYSILTTGVCNISSCCLSFISCYEGFLMIFTPLYTYLCF
jgi:hypothetical protein